MIVVIAGIIKKGAQYLVAKRAAADYQGGLWEFPGGKIHAHETPEECLKREIKEELAIDIDVGKFVCVSKYTDARISIELLAYEARHVAGEITLHEHDECAWITVDEMNGYEFAPADMPIINMLKEERRAR